MKIPKINTAEVERFYELLGHKSETEIRAIDPNKRGAIVPQFAKTKEDFVKLVEGNNGTKNVYSALNEREQGGTKQEDVISLNCVLVDIDPIRRRTAEDKGITDEALASGKVAATDAEMAKAIAKTREVVRGLEGTMGYEVGGVIMSGNGCGILIPLSPSIEVTDANRDTLGTNLKAFGLHLTQHYNDDDTTIDPTVFELARITKVPGTLSIKGENLPHRPHRLAKWIEYYGPKRNDKLRARLLKKPKIKRATTKQGLVVPVAIANEIKTQIENGTILTNSSGKVPAGQRHYAYMSVFGVLSNQGYARGQINAAIQYLNQTFTEHPKSFEAVAAELEGIYYPTKSEVTPDDFAKGAERLRQELANIQCAELGSLSTDGGVCFAPMRHGKDFLPGPYADKIQKAVPIVTLEQTLEMFYFEAQTGVYLPAEGKLRQWTQQLLAQLNKPNKFAQVRHIIQGSTIRSMEGLTPPAHLIAVKNGILDTQTGTLTPHTPDWFFVSFLPVTFDPEAKCPEIEKFMASLVDDVELRTTLYEAIAYCLHRGYPIQKLIVLLGGGDNGKSTFLNLLQAFLGEENISHLSLQEIGNNPFAKVQLYQKFANIFDDLDQSALKQTGTLKMATGGGRFAAEKKHQQARVHFTNTAKMIFSANNLPVTLTDDSPAFFRRMELIPLVKRFLVGSKERDANMLDKITTPSELSGLLNKCLEILPGLIKKAAYTHSPATESVQADYINRSDPVAAFVGANLRREVLGTIAKDAVYSAYVDYCEKRKVPAKANNIFTTELKRVAAWITTTYERRPEGRTMCYKGCVWKAADTDPPKKKAGQQDLEEQK